MEAQIGTTPLFAEQVAGEISCPAGIPGRLIFRIRSHERVPSIKSTRESTPLDTNTQRSFMLAIARYLGHSASDRPTAITLVVYGHGEARGNCNGKNSCSSGGARGHGAAD